MTKSLMFFHFALSLLTSIFCGCDLGSEVQKPDEQFVKILYEYGFRNSLDTYNCLLTKDLVFDGTITVPFWLTTAEQQAIVSELSRIDFFSLPDTLLPLEGVEMSPNPGPQTLRVELAGNTKSVIWTLPLDKTRLDNQSIEELSRCLERVIESKEEYKRLPLARGGYY